MQWTAKKFTKTCDALATRLRSMAVLVGRAKLVMKAGEGRETARGANFAASPLVRPARQNRHATQASDARAKLLFWFDRMIFQSESCRCRSCREFCKHLICLTGLSWLIFRKFWLYRIKKGFNMQFTKLYVHVQCLFFDWLTKNRRYLIRKIFASNIDWR